MTGTTFTTPTTTTTIFTASQSVNAAAAASLKQEGDGETNTRTIVGATVGGVVGLAALSGGAYLMLARTACSKISPFGDKR